jgi:hypothetical protein
MKRIILFCALILIATTGLAAKQEKTLICHVGNEMGPNGETYLDDPGCVPHLDNDWFCPDAGKIDLIEVAKPNKHLDNDLHSYDGISDYLPGEIGASGEGDEDSNGDGIDDGCETEELLTCLCWDGFTESELVIALESGTVTTPQCSVDAGLAVARDGSDDDPLLRASVGSSGGGECQLFLGSTRIGMGFQDSNRALECWLEAEAVISQITWCSPD